MREIKFRAWDKRFSIMNRGLFGMRSDGVVSYNANPEDVILMQYTGLKDKNGKEIFEGDVVKGDVPYLMVVVSIYGGLSIHPIRNLGQKHNELIAMPTNDAQTASWLMETEIIGNIYENPDLKEGL